MICNSACLKTRSKPGFLQGTSFVPCRTRKGSEYAGGASDRNEDFSRAASVLVAWQLHRKRQTAEAAGSVSYAFENKTGPGKPDPVLFLNFWWSRGDANSGFRRERPYRQSRRVKSAANDNHAVSAEYVKNFLMPLDNLVWSGQTMWVDGRQDDADHQYF